ncbi:MAG: site-specific DNA-methyltransferase [bacterium]|nr:site-specific DNA-methyltransferase [bacterium]
MDSTRPIPQDFMADNTEKIAALFPSCLTEIQDGSGLIKRAINFERLRQLLEPTLKTSEPETYGFTWPGKKAAQAEAERPIDKLLHPCPEASLNWETTDNIFIEGDNLDALKLLRENYLNKIKMIYIDPPYNTGHDFIYNDNYRSRSKKWPDSSAAAPNDAYLIQKKTAKPGRFHAGWCSMIYPRLLLAKDLLTEDGVIFISIDDVENANLRQICHEIFGEDNFLAQFVWQTKRAARGVPPRTMVTSSCEYILAYARNLSQVRFSGLPRDEADFANPDNDPRGLWRSESLRATGRQNNFFSIRDPQSGREFYGNWAFSQKSIAEMIASQLIIFPSNPQGTPRQKKFINSYKNTTKAITTNLGWHSTERATSELIELFGGRKVFDFSKPLSLIAFLVQQATTPGDIVLDFFAGSATTAHAVMQVNTEDGGQRRFIMVQQPEPCDEASDGFKAGFSNIAEIGRERIRRAGQQLCEHDTAAYLLPGFAADCGFRAYKVIDR